MSKYVVGRFSFRTDVGKVRPNNEDQAVAMMNANGDVLLLVCDGMGGRNKGDYASLLAKQSLIDSFSSKKKFFTKALTISWLRKAVREANTLVFNESIKKPECKGMGTTLTVVLIVKEDIIVGQIGDSRAYYVDANDQFVQLTEDQTEVMRLYKLGKISYEEMETHPNRHIITNALGVCPSANVIITSYKNEDQSILLCSDGLYNNVPNSVIANIIKGKDSPEQKVNQLIAMANANGGSDNIGVVVWEALK